MPKPKRFLLITTTGCRNPGDELIRIGVQKLVRGVVPDASFDLLDKEIEEDRANERRFDKTILCGMPLFWNHRHHRTSDIDWWGPLLHGWPVKSQHDFLMLGVGDACSMHGPYDYRSYQEDINLCCGLASRVTTRNRISDCVYPRNMTDLCCPAFFASRGVERRGGLRLCNLMPFGSHDPVFSYAESMESITRANSTARWFINNGFKFISHHPNDARYARELGFKPADIITSNTVDGYIEEYSRCSVYIGNRVHGAILARSFGAQSLVIGYDTRTRAAETVGCNASLPSETGIPQLDEWLANSRQPDPTPYAESMWRKNLEVVSEFCQ